MPATLSRNPRNSGIPSENRHGSKGMVCSLQRSRGSSRKASRHSRFLGVETLDELVWEGWELGREYTKTLVLKNVNEKLKKLSFRPPVSTVFTIPLFLQTIILSPGTSFSMPITFHPHQKCEHEDSIEFKCKDGTFLVKLRAVMLHHALELPDSVQLPPCAVQHSTSTSFLLCNASKLQTCFQWVVEPPFELSPLSGVLEPGMHCRVSVTFKPQQALVYQTEASCTFGKEGENNCTVLLKGVSKYPHIQISSPGPEEDGKLLEFGSVAIGSCLEKHFEIYNPTSVLISFSLTRMKKPAHMESVFECDVQGGQLAPCATLRVPVRFTPLTVDNISVDYFRLSCPGGVRTDMLKVSGSCIGPEVTLSSSLVDFGCVEEGAEAVRIIRIINSSTVQAHYQFDIDRGNHSVFTLEKPVGTLPAKESLTLHFIFRPYHPIAYHKRAVCLILHREPLLLDLIGTCHSEQLKPHILQPRHLRVYRQNLLRGLTCYPPDILSAMLSDHKLQLDESGALLFQKDSSEDMTLSRSPLSPRSVMEEYFHMNSADKAREHPNETGDPECFPLPHVTVEPSELLFYSGPKSKSVTITNHTKGNLRLLWTPAAESPFSITPLTCDLSPLKSTAFIVTYTPKQHNAFQAAQLECFGLYKIMRDYRQTEDRTLCPPWCLTVRVTAHSFQPRNEHFIPYFSLQTNQVMFPALNQVSYRSLLLQNTGDLPLIFKLNTKDCPDVFVLPSSGLVPPGSHQILILKSTPIEENPDSLPMTLQLNASPKHRQELRVVCVAERPRITLEGDGNLFFIPTGVGSCSKATLSIRNFSRVPLHFHWRFSGSDRRVLSVQPDSGILQPNESQVQTWSFSPLEEMVYNMKPSLIFWPIQKPEYKRSKLSLKVVGLSAKGSIEAGHSFLDLGEMLVGGCKSFDIPLLNTSPCAVSFSLTVQQSISAPGIPEDSLKDPLVLDMENMKGIIPARCQLLIHSTVRPIRRARYRWTIGYNILNAAGLVEGESSSLCQVEVEVVYPTLQVTDARGSGSMEGLSKLYLWDLFCLDTLKSYFLSEPAPPELIYRVPTRHSFHRCPPVLTSAILDFNFSAAPLNADPSNVLLMFMNPGNILVEWSFLFPEDQQIELECWADTEELSPNEILQMKVQENRMFSVSPRSDKLQPGQQRAVQLTYKHDFVGMHRLPVLLKLSHGREILLNFIGVTVEKDRHYLHFPSTRHVFAPVAIGGFHPPIQVYELYNGGAQPVRYRVDTLPLQELQEENFSHPVLQCLNPEGDVQPGCTASLRWIFSPLEAKTYSVDIPIYMLEGESVAVTFEGCGFDKIDSVPLQLHDGHLAVPCIQKVSIPGQVVFLSEERVSFGDIPVSSRNTRILFLSNVSRTDRVFYSWKLKEQTGKQAVQIHPDSGSLAAEESVLCILTIYTSNNPTFYQQDLICEVTAESSLACYQMDLQQWKEEKEREKHEFTITEKDLIQTNSRKKNTQRGTAAQKKSSTENRKFKMLPPISSNSGSGLGGPNSRAENKAQGDVRVRQPQPPRPKLLHLGVTARSHSLLEYQAQFSSQFSKHYIYRSAPSKLPQPESVDSKLFSANMPYLTHGPERDILTNTLTSLLRSLLDDTEFHQELQNTLNEPAPYFTQLRPVSSVLPMTSTETPCAKDTICLTNSRLSTNHMKSTDTVAHTHTQSEVEPQLCHELNPKLREQVQESIRRSTEFGDLMEEILLNTLKNLMTEAFLGELVLTARPRIITLPPGSARRNSKKL
ncbi:cilia- and flagella-associated protein 65 [Clarias gariepinus]|uniref:cilia- and flagella-associated protein 65 n=1 Tax=Clarias gariepinus TaxID=13013 RepID=UPI00234C4FB2|nr:cilia- and flagella-associated protein 65 [Clarias gariepinus]